MTAAGKTPACRVLVVGGGVAGLAAVQAARGLGAHTMCFDTRPAVEEQARARGSMGGRGAALAAPPRSRARRARPPAAPP